MSGSPGHWSRQKGCVFSETCPECASGDSKPLSFRRGSAEGQGCAGGEDGSPGGKGRDSVDNSNPLDFCRRRFSTVEANVDDSDADPDVEGHNSPLDASDE